MKRTPCFIVHPFAVACATASGTAPPDLGARPPEQAADGEERRLHVGAERSGPVNDLEGRLRLPDENWRKVASSVGVADRASLGAARDRIAREGGVPNTFLFAAGVRAWFLP